MKRYSAQEEKFIDCTMYAFSVYKELYNKTWVDYFQDSNGLIHSSSYDYSIIFNPTTVEEFNELAEKYRGEGFRVEFKK